MAERRKKKGYFIMKTVNTTQNISNRLTDTQIDASLTDVAAKLADRTKYTVALPVVDTNSSAVEICYNGYVIRIKRGVSVDIPEPIYLLLRHTGILGE